MSFLLSPVGRYLLAAGAAVLLVGAAYFYVDHKARVDERNAVAARALEQTIKDHKDREKNDEKAGSLDDAAALKCLRNPAGCR